MLFWKDRGGKRKNKFILFLWIFIFFGELFIVRVILVFYRVFCISVVGRIEILGVFKYLFLSF